MNKRLIILRCLTVLACSLPCAPMAHADPGSPEIKYRVRISGVDDSSLREDVRSVSDAISLIKRRPISDLQLRRRAERDIPRFQQVLRSHGYYAAEIALDIDKERRPARVRFRVEPGPRYAFRDIRLLPAHEHADAPAAPAPGEVELIPGEPALARKILQAEDRLVRALERKGYPYARVTRREVRVEHRARAVDVTYWYETGPPATFGELTVSGLTSVRESFVLSKAPWQPGEPYDGSLLRLAQRRMTASDLFTSVRIVKAEELTPDGALPLIVQVSERKHRSIGFGVGYASDEGARGRVSWEHRNLFNAGERLTWSAFLTEIGYASEARFRKPDYRRVDQTLTVSLRAALDEPDAYRSRNVGALVGIDRLLRQDLLLGSGVGFRYVSVRESDEENRFGLLYIPLHIDWDRSDDLLDPRRGGRVNLSAAPYTDITGQEVTFLKGKAAFTRYQRVTKRPELDWAGRLILGSIGGAARDDVPADERFYAGGGGTVRGYAFQSVGPLDGKDPLGGKSMTLISSELRWRWSPEFGMVVFADGGAAYAASVPETTADFLWGAGFGFRYFTPVGPLRFDLAFPLNRRSGVDDAYQFYISLGQAF